MGGTIRWPWMVLLTVVLAAANGVPAHGALPATLAPMDVHDPGAFGQPGPGPIFIENVGQFAAGARFQVRGGDSLLWLAEDAMWLTVLDPPRSSSDAVVGDEGSSTPEDIAPPTAGVHLRLSFAGANPHPRLEPFGRLATHVSYFIGNNPQQWHTDVPAWSGVRFAELYPGIDLVIGGEDGSMRQRLVAREGADLAAVRLRVEGAEALAVDGEHLRLATAVGEIALQLPVTKTAPAGSAAIAKEGGGVFVVTAPFAVASMPASAPEDNAAGLVYSTFLGGAEYDNGYDVKVDAAGQAYATGWTLSDGFPTTPGAFDRLRAGQDAFAVKVNAAGTGLVYATFLGGSDAERGMALDVDTAGAAYVTGNTRSANFPATPGAFDTGHNGAEDVFVVKLNALGNGLVFSTLLGGNGYDYGLAIAVDGSGAPYLTGHTDSANWPATPGAYDTTYNGQGSWPRFSATYGDAFVAKLSPAGSSLDYCTYLGGGSFEARFTGIALLAGGDALVTGVTGSANFPTTAGAFDRTHNGGADVYLASLSADGHTLVYSTFLGGSDDEQGDAVGIDGTGMVYVVGWTYSAGFPSTSGTFAPNHHGSCDGFVTKLSPSLGSLAYGAFVGGSGSDGTYDIALDGNLVATVTGATASSDLSTTPGAFDTSHNGGDDAYVVQINADATDLLYGSFLGGGALDRGHEVAVEGSGSMVIIGETESSGFPVTAGAFDTAHNGFLDASLSKLTASRPAPVIAGLTPAAATAGGPGFTLTVWGSHLAADSVVRWNGMDRQTTFVNGGCLTAQIGADDIAAAGLVPVAVYTPAPGGGLSEPWPFTVHRPAPTITALSPAWVPAGAGGFGLLVQGTDLSPESVVRWNGSARPTAFVSSSQVVADIAAADTASIRAAGVTVYTPPPGGGVSNELAFIVADAYEPDGICTLADPISTSGTVQVRTFHQAGDVDWARFDATSDTTYLIEVSIPAGSPADVILELRDDCAGLPLATQDYAFAPGARLEFTASTTGPHYLKVLDNDPGAAGAHVAYHLSIRALGAEPLPGALILVAGRLKTPDRLQPNIHHVTDAVYHLFRSHNYPDDRIVYLATDLALDGVDALPSVDNLASAITSWAVDRVGPDRALTLYLMDHGGYDRFYLDKPRNEQLSPQQLDGWLDLLEAAAPGVRVNIVVEACFSGSFIDLLQSVSKPGRVVIASTSADRNAWASDDGAAFSDPFVASLAQDYSLFSSFELGRWAVEAGGLDQAPWLDDDGDGLANGPEDGREAARRGFAYAGTFDPGWPPYIVQAQGPTTMQQGQGLIRAEVRDDEAVDLVWAVLYPPSYPQPRPGDEMPQEPPAAVVLVSQGGDWYGVTYDFDELGAYRVVVYAQDETGMRSRPAAIEVRTGWGVYLPLVHKR